MEYAEYCTELIKDPLWSVTCKYIKNNITKCTHAMIRKGIIVVE